MSEMEEKLNSILTNPQLMQQIMSMAQTLGAGKPSPKENEPKTPEKQNFPTTNMDWNAIQKLSGIARQNGTDQQQQALLHALTPYLSHSRVNKLERAMRAARMAGAASAFLSAGGLQMLTGR